MNIGENIKKYRKLKGLTQVQLAKEINKSESTIQKYESNSVTPDFSILNDIAAALECTVYDLTIDTEEIKNDVRLLESEKHIEALAKKYGFTIEKEYDDDGDGEYLRYVHISFSDKNFRLRGNEFHELTQRIIDSVIINILASENYNKL